MLKKSTVLKTLLIAITAMLSACQDEAADKKEITVGFGPSSYVDQFEKGIQPILEKKGYKVTAKVFSQNPQINPSLKEGSINATVHQSIAYMTDMNGKLAMDMTKLVDTPSAPQSIRSLKHDALVVTEGMVVAVPMVPVNEVRAIRMLEELGWIKVKPDAGTATFSLSSVEMGDVKFIIKELDEAQALRSLEDVDYAIINGNYIANAGLKISDGLMVEKTPPEHVVVVVIRDQDKDKTWAKDLKAAYESKEFEAYIKSEPRYEGFIFPSHWSK